MRPSSSRWPAHHHPPSPEGRARWTMHPLTDRGVVLTEVESVSARTVHRRLSEKFLKTWQKRTWCTPKIDAEFVAEMEHVLDLYAEPEDPRGPVVNFDQRLKQPVSETRVPAPRKLGRPERVVYEYRRHGTASPFVFFCRHRRWRRREGDCEEDQPRLRQVHARPRRYPIPRGRYHPGRPRSLI